MRSGLYGSAPGGDDYIRPMRPLGPPRNAWAAEAGRVDLGRRRPPSRPLEVPATPQDLVLDVGRCAAVVIDMQNDFCHPEGWLASQGVDITPARAPIPVLHRLLPALRSSDVPVLWLNWGNRPDRANVPPGVAHVYDPEARGVGLGHPLPGSGSRMLERGSWSASVVDELAPDPADLRVDKYRMSGFFDTELDSVLRNLDVTTLLFAGVNADQCVLATLTDAACLGYDCIFLSDCCATTSPSYCWEATLYNVAQCFGFVATGEELLARL